MSDADKATPRPWFAEKRDWKGEESPHRIYISGDRHVAHDDEDQDDEGSEVATAVAIVEGNRTSGGVTEANAELIVRAVNAFGKLLAYAECEQAWTDWASDEATYEQVENVLRRHGWIEGKDPEDFVDGLRRDGLASAKGETTPCSPAE